METKMVLVVRKDLGMTKGKIAAQCSHASMMWLTEDYHKSGELNPEFKKELSEAEQYWLSNAFAKVTVYVNSEEELNMIKEKADEAGLKTRLVIDAGRTHFHGVPTPTVLGIGPDFVENFTNITDGLKLL